MLSAGCVLLCLGKHEKGMSRVFPSAAAVVVLADFIISHGVGRPLSLHGWVCQRAWDGRAGSAGLLPNKTPVILGAACVCQRCVDPVVGGFLVPREKEVSEVQCC